MAPQAQLGVRIFKERLLQALERGEIPSLGKQDELHLLKRDLGKVHGFQSIAADLEVCMRLDFVDLQQITATAS